MTIRTRRRRRYIRRVGFRRTTTSVRLSIGFNLRQAHLRWRPPSLRQQYLIGQRRRAFAGGVQDVADLAPEEPPAKPPLGLQRLIAEVTGFPGSRHADQVDSNCCRAGRAVEIGVVTSVSAVKHPNTFTTPPIWTYAHGRGWVQCDRRAESLDA